MPAHVTVSQFTDRRALVAAAAEQFADLLRGIQADPAGGIHGDGVARVVLTGGTAGIELLSAMATLKDIDFNRVEFFFGDERNVPATHPDSNEGQARAALLSKVNVSAERIHGWGLDGGDMSDQVREYASTVAQHAPRGFDLHLLGMGGEGHINSLFPHTDAVREDTRTTLAVTDSPKPPAERATLTLPAVRSAERVWLLVAGAEKAEAASHVAHGAPAEEWPAAGAQGRAETVLFVSDDAASML
ncbi:MULTISPECIES: 6-phosphogluconolactonase [Corynebacterium]|uniref:6-phosphogluconolactonase n=1 Tax=Corynebacterium TaxID=1716 RepID=UPI001E6306BA|nr:MULTISPECIES: 6-phosphogluconolactonase [Corynebacterium]WKC60180.1 6-phosphogluconolactonase [Corynebacterium hadale]